MVIYSRVSVENEDLFLHRVFRRRKVLTEVDQNTEALYP